MPLTPADVRNKQFSTTRLRPGYDEEEVDAFLDEVEAELDRLIQENEELRGKLAEALRGKVPPMSAQDAQPEAHYAPDQQAHMQQPPPPPQLEQQQFAPEAQYAQPEPQYAPEPQQYAPEQQAHMQQPSAPQQAAAMGMAMPAESGDNMDTASRVLALAQQTADQAISDARREADETLGRARHEAEDILGKARRQAEQIVNEARARSENLDRDAQERHRQVMGSLVQQRDDLEHRVNVLKDFEREYRSRLKDYFERQLRELAEGAQEVSATTTGNTPVMSNTTGSGSLQAGPGNGGMPTGTNPFAQPEQVQQQPAYHPGEAPHEHR